MKRLKAESKIRKYTLLEMLFADDATVCAHSEEKLQEIMQIYFTKLFKNLAYNSLLKNQKSWCKNVTRTKQDLSPK